LNFIIGSSDAEPKQKVKEVEALGKNLVEIWTSSAKAGSGVSRFLNLKDFGRGLNQAAIQRNENAGGANLKYACYMI
jgi:hypothetical protein